MKLVLCTVCGDGVVLAVQERACGCGRTSGRYTDHRHIETTGTARVIGLNNNDITALFHGDVDDNADIRAFGICEHSPAVTYLT